MNISSMTCFLTTAISMAIFLQYTECHRSSGMLFYRRISTLSGAGPFLNLAIAPECDLFQ
jgi:hypothetical protein